MVFLIIYYLRNDISIDFDDLADITLDGRVQLSMIPKYYVTLLAGHVQASASTTTNDILAGLENKLMDDNFLPAFWAVRAHILPKTHQALRVGDVVKVDSEYYVLSGPLFTRFA